MTTAIRQTSLGTTPIDKAEVMRQAVKYHPMGISIFGKYVSISSNQGEEIDDAGQAIFESGQDPAKVAIVANVLGIYRLDILGDPRSKKHGSGLYYTNISPEPEARRSTTAKVSGALKVDSVFVKTNRTRSAWREGNNDY